MNKIFVILVAMLVVSMTTVVATPADTIKEGTTTTVFNEEGAFHNFVDNGVGTFHCNLKPFTKNQPQGKGWHNFWDADVFWAKCNAFGPKYIE